MLPPVGGGDVAEVVNPAARRCKCRGGVLPRSLERPTKWIQDTGFVPRQCTMLTHLVSTCQWTAFWNHRKWTAARVRRVSTGRDVPLGVNAAQFQGAGHAINRHDGAAMMIIHPVVSA